MLRPNNGDAGSVCSVRSTRSGRSNRSSGGRSSRSRNEFAAMASVRRRIQEQDPGGRLSNGESPTIKQIILELGKKLIRFGIRALVFAAVVSVMMVRVIQSSASRRVSMNAVTIAMRPQSGNISNYYATQQRSLADRPRSTGSFNQSLITGQLQGSSLQQQGSETGEGALPGVSQGMLQNQNSTAGSQQQQTNTGGGVGGGILGGQVNNGGTGGGLLGANGGAAGGLLGANGGAAGGLLGANGGAAGGILGAGGGGTGGILGAAGGGGGILGAGGGILGAGGGAAAGGILGAGGGAATGGILGGGGSGILGAEGGAAGGLLGGGGVLGAVGGDAGGGILGANGQQSGNLMTSQNNGLVMGQQQSLANGQLANGAANNTMLERNRHLSSNQSLTQLRQGGQIGQTDQGVSNVGDELGLETDMAANQLESDIEGNGGMPVVSNKLARIRVKNATSGVVDQMGQGQLSNAVMGSKTGRNQMSAKLGNMQVDAVSDSQVQDNDGNTSPIASNGLQAPGLGSASMKSTNLAGVGGTSQMPLADGRTGTVGPKGGKVQGQQLGGQVMAQGQQLEDGDQVEDATLSGSAGNAAKAGGSKNAGAASNLKSMKLSRAKGATEGLVNKNSDIMEESNADSPNVMSKGMKTGAIIGKLQQGLPKGGFPSQADDGLAGGSTGALIQGRATSKGDSSGMGLSNMKLQAKGTVKGNSKIELPVEQGEPTEEAEDAIMGSGLPTTTNVGAAGDGKTNPVRQVGTRSQTGTALQKGSRTINSDPSGMAASLAAASTMKTRNMDSSNLRGAAGAGSSGGELASNSLSNAKSSSTSSKVSGSTSKGASSSNSKLRTSSGGVRSN